MFREPRVSTPATYKEYAADCLTAMRAAVLPEVRALLEEAADLNRKEPVTGTKVQMKQSRAAGAR